VTTHTATVWARVVERRRAVALARHYREVEGLSIAGIADRLGRSPAMVKAYFYDPTGEKAGAVKARYVGVCQGCGAYTQPRNGKGDAYAYCKACHPGAIKRRWFAPMCARSGCTISGTRSVRPWRPQAKSASAPSSARAPRRSRLRHLP